MAMRILIAPNAFKNSLPADEAARAIQRGLSLSRLVHTSECHPIGDGGDGTGDLIIRQLQGQFIPARVSDPLGRIIDSSFGLIDDGRTAVIEMAHASGLRLLDLKELDPLHTSSSGTGDLIRMALDRNVKKIILGIGGSATVDGGTGILQALGVRFLDGQGAPLTGLPESLTEAVTIDISGLDPRIHNVELIVLCDVDNLLLGEEGAAAVFGPQKGASPQGVRKLEASLTKFRELALHHTGKDLGAIRSGGAAGGAAAGLYGFLGARLVNGIDTFLELTGFENVLQQCDLVITGEGSIDLQTLQGKGPYGVAVRAKARGLPVIGLAGRVPLEKDLSLEKYFDVLLAIGNSPMGLAEALQSTEANLVRTAKEVGDLLAIYSHPLA